jgi:adenine-specific DNA-methyltransferase
LPKKNKYTNWSKEEIIKRIEALEKRKKYGLVWDEEKTKEKFEADVEGKFPVLKEIKSKEIKTDPKQATHILIEGDNYHALSVLSYTHDKNIDVIYIDPPFNTGTNSWRYNNSYVEKDDAFKHSKWLSFMYKRLLLAKKLLKKDGSIIIAIDDYEVHHLGLLLEEIFYNYEIDLIIIEHHPQGAGSNTVSRTHEYAFICTPKNIGFKGREERHEKNTWSLKRSGQGENN